MGVGRGKSCTSPETVPVTPPPPVHDYNVTGALTPDATCNYDLAGTFNDQPYYQRGSDLWFLFWDSAEEQYVLAVTLENSLPNKWWREIDIIGEYTPWGTCEGTPVVAAGGH